MASHASGTLKGRVEEFHTKYDALIDAAIAGIPSGVEKKLDAPEYLKEKVALHVILADIKRAIKLSPSEVRRDYEGWLNDTSTHQTSAYTNPNQAIDFAEKHLVPILRGKVAEVSKGGLQYEDLQPKPKAIVDSYAIVAALFDEWKQGGYLQALYHDLHTAKKNEDLAAQKQAKVKAEKGEQSFLDLVEASRSALKIGGKGK